MIVRTEGFSELLKAMNDLPDKVNKKATVDALVEAAEPMADVASELAPRLSGVGARSIVASSKSRAKGLPRLAEYVYRAFVGPTKHTRQLMDAEFGTAPRSQKTTGRDTGQEPAAPFLRPAFDTQKENVVKRFGPLLAIQIKLAFERVYKKVR